MQLIIERFKAAIDALVDGAKGELRQQGHKATGRLENSFEVDFDFSDLNRLIARIYVADYALPLDSGVPASRIPYSRPGRAKTSKYIEGLIQWAGVVKPGLNEKQRRSFAFAVATAHKREGMPTAGSYSFSKNGRRTEWIKHGLEEPAQDLGKDLKLFELAAEYFEQIAKKVA